MARKSVSFLMIAVLTAFVLAAFCAPLGKDCISVLAHGWGERQYLAAAAGGETAALVSRDKDAFRLTLGTLDGKRTGEWKSNLPVSAADCTVAALYPASDQSVFLGVYEPGDQAAENLAVYRLTADGGVQRLMTYPCSGSSASERMASTVLSGFTEQEGDVSFALIDGGMVQVYTYGAADNGLTQGEMQSAGDAASAAVLADGTVALGGTGWLTIDGRSVFFPVEDHIVTNLTQVGAGLCYIDGASLKVFYSDLAGSECAEVLDLANNGTLDGMTSLSLTRDGGVLLLRDAHTLELVQSGGTTELDGLLYRSAAVSVLILLGLVVLWLVVTVLIWYLLCGRQHSQLPLVIRTGGLLAVCTLLIGALVGNLLVKPLLESAQEQEVENVLAAAAALASDSSSYGDQAARTAAGLSSLTDGAYAQASATLYQHMGSHWTVTETSGRVPSGSDASLTPYFSAEQAEQAMQQGSAFAVQDGVYRLSLQVDAQVLQVSLTGGALEAQMAQQDTRVLRGLWAGAALLWAVMMLVLLAISRNLRKVSHAMEQLADRNTAVRLAMPTGDELEGLAVSFNSMARSMQLQEGERDGLIRAYLRFVPERVLRLLGKQSVLEVDKRTFASRRLSAMMVWFEFPGRVYDNSTRALFESINEVIERTAAIVSRKGGTVFNFAYNGYDVVLDGDESKAVSTAVAVQQEVLSLNEQRALDGLPTVTLRIALDVGEVMIGIVGDETQMEPATISASFTTARRLIGLAGRLEAGILCTENMIAGAEGYGSRYMGKSRQGSELVRVYEIYDGDSFGVRRSKQNTGRRFSEGVFALYSHDFTAAKRIFLELVHDNPGDGGARYYLYLADRLEKQPDQEISLEC